MEPETILPPMVDEQETDAEPQKHSMWSYAPVVVFALATVAALFLIRTIVLPAWILPSATPTIYNMDTDSSLIRSTCSPVAVELEFKTIAHAQMIRTRLLTGLLEGFVIIQGSKLVSCPTDPSKLKGEVQRKIIRVESSALMVKLFTANYDGILGKRRLHIAPQDIAKPKTNAKKGDWFPDADLPRRLSHLNSTGNTTFPPYTSFPPYNPNSTHPRYYSGDAYCNSAQSGWISSYTSNYYYFLTPTSGYVFLSLCRSFFDTTLSVARYGSTYNGSNSSNSSSYYCDDCGCTATLQTSQMFVIAGSGAAPFGSGYHRGTTVLQGNTYYQIDIGGYTSSYGRYYLDVSCCSTSNCGSSPPPSTTWAPLGNGSVTFQGSAYCNDYYSYSSYIYSHGKAYYSFYTPNSGYVNISLCSSYMDTTLGVGESWRNFSDPSFYCDDCTCPKQTAQTFVISGSGAAPFTDLGVGTTVLRPNTYYNIVVGGYGSSYGTAMLDIACCQYEFGCATRRQPSTTYRPYTTRYNPNNPHVNPFIHGGSIQCNTAQRSVLSRYTYKYYDFVTPASGYVNISLCQSSFDTTMSLVPWSLNNLTAFSWYCDDCGCPLQTAQSFVVGLGGVGPVSYGWGATVLQPNTRYAIAVGGFASSAGSFRLDVSCCPVENGCGDVPPILLTSGSPTAQPTVLPGNPTKSPVRGTSLNTIDGSPAAVAMCWTWLAVVFVGLSVY